MNCPCCGHEIEQLPFEGLRDVPLERQHRIIVDTLIRANPRLVSKGVLLDALYGDDSAGGPLHADGVIAVRMTQLRKRLKPTGWTVSSANSGLGSTSAGYRLVPVK